MIKILAIVDNLNQASGVTAVIRTHQACFDPTEISHDFLIAGSHQRKDCEIGISPESRFFFIRPAINPINFYLDLFRILSKRRGHYDLVHIHTPTRACLVNFALKLMGVRSIIMHIHSNELSEQRWKTPINKLLFSLGKFFVDRFIFCSEASYSSYREKNLIKPSDKTTVIPNGVIPTRFLFDAESRDNARENLKIHKKNIALIQIGRLNENKNQEFSIRLLDQLPESYILILVGSGPSEGRLKELVRTKSLDSRVHFLGTRSDIHSLLLAADVLLQPSLSEGLPMVILEAQSSGLPVLASNRITSEIQSLPSVQFMHLGDPASWISAILHAPVTNINRMESIHHLESSIFNATNSTELLHKVYTAHTEG